MSSIEADDQGDHAIQPSHYSDTDSSYGGDDAASYTTSLRSSVMAYKTENQRRYHAYKEGAYYFPNDNKEMERLDMIHQMQKILKNNRLYMAPLDKMQLKTVLDLGTGTGIWAIEMGDEHPEAEVTGTDLSPIQPTMVPPNVKFEIDDMEQEWTFSHPFSFIHLSYMVTSLNDHAKVIKRGFENLEPGGWMEAFDYDLEFTSDDGTAKEDGAILRWMRGFDEPMAKIGRTLHAGRQLEGWFKDAGFTNITVVAKKAPIGPWPANKQLKQLGAWNLCQTLEGLEGFTMAFYTRLGGWTADQTSVLLAQVRADMQNPQIHCYYRGYTVYGQRPVDDKVETPKLGLEAGEDNQQQHA